MPVVASVAPITAADDLSDVSDSKKVFCICRKPDTGQWMVACDGRCDDWYHGDCVNIHIGDEALLLKYFCPACTASGIGITQWRKKCRIKDCRKAATALKAANEKENEALSDDAKLYCSRQHAADFWISIIDKSTLSKGTIASLVSYSSSGLHFRTLGNDKPKVSQDQLEGAISSEQRDTLKKLELQIEQLNAKFREREAFMRYLHNARDSAKKLNDEIKAQNDKTKREICGFDSRLLSSDQEWRKYLAEPEGAQFNDPNVPPTITNTTTICSLEKRKCGRHAQWQSIRADDVQLDMEELELSIKTLRDVQARVWHDTEINVLKSQILD